MDWSNIFPSACYEGLLFGLVAIGVYLTFRILSFPDLSVDGTFPLGGAVVAVLIADHGWNPFLATLMAIMAGFCAGLFTGLLNTKLRISALLSGILVMVGLWSVNLRIMGGSNQPLIRDRTIFNVAEDWLGLHGKELEIVTVLIVVVAVFAFLNWFLRTDLGLALRATGDNEPMVRSLGMDTDKSILLGCAISNSLVALAGALLAQNQGFTDVGMGFGIIVQGLATVILGEALLRPRGISRILIASLIGAFMYRFAIIVALRQDWLQPGDLKGATALLVIIILAIPYIKKRMRREWIPPAKRM
ncbi:ABC transporter permease [Chloroflexota bacterium]